MSEYPAGTVAMVTAYNRNTPYRAYFDGKTWREHGADLFCVDVPTSIRPLVVLDPEDGEEVERLWVALRDGLALRSRVNLADALTSLARPPKPAEPTGLGAVVEDAEGVRWTLYTHPDSTAPWFGEGVSSEYADITAARILSEGVTA